MARIVATATGVTPAKIRCTLTNNIPREANVSAPFQLRPGQRNGRDKYSTLIWSAFSNL
jgi:hypothetical protein